MSLPSQLKYAAIAVLALFVSTGANAAALAVTGTPPIRATAGYDYYFNANATGGTGSNYVFSITNKPAWATFNTTTGELKGKPTVAGTFSNIVVKVTDGVSNASAPAFAIQVDGSGSTSTAKLTIIGVPQIKVTSGSDYYFNADATGATGTIAFSITNKPSWATFNTATGELKGKPVTAGTFSQVVVSVTDGANTASTQPFAIEVVSSSVVKTAAGAQVTWSAPDTNVDGSALDTLSGYVVRYGTSASTLDQKVAIGSAVITSYTISGLTAGKIYYFAVSAVTVQNIEGEASAVISLQM